MKTLFNKNKSAKLLKTDAAFTLVEVLIAMAVLAMLIYGLYTLFSRTVKNVDVGDWKAKNQIKLRTATKQLHKDITAATYPSEITLSETKIDKDTKWDLAYKDGATDIKTFNGQLLKFYICTPGKNVPDEKVDQKIIEAVLTSEMSEGHSRLMYSKKVIKGSADKDVENNKKVILLEDASNFDAKIIKSTDATSSDVENRDKYILKIEIQATHPRYEKTIHTEIIEIPLQVKAKK